MLDGVSIENIRSLYIREGGRGRERDRQSDRQNSDLTNLGDYRYKLINTKLSESQLTTIIPFTFAATSLRFVILNKACSLVFKLT